MPTQTQGASYIQEEKFRETRIGLIPEDWKIVRLAEVLDELKLRAKSLTEYRDIHVFSLSKNEGLIPQEKRFKHRIAKKDVSNYKVVRKGWLVYNPYVIWEGAISILSNSDVALVSPAYAVFKVKRGNYEYLGYLVKTKKVLQIFFSLASGVVQRRRSISKQAFLDVEIPFPPVEEQDRIAYVLSTIKKAIEQQDKIIETMKKLKKSVMQKLFTEGLGHTKFRETEIGQIPTSWKLERLKDVLNFSKKPRNLDLNSFEKIPFIPMRMIPIGRTHVNTYLLKEPDKISSGVYCEKGDILLPKITPCFENGKQGIVENIPYDFAFATTEVYPIKPKNNELDRMFLFYFLTKPDVRKTIASKMQGTTGRQRVPKDVVGNALIPLPQVSEQREIARILDIVGKKIQVEEKRKASLNELFKTTVHKLMTGEIRLRNVEV